jgi:hypothetical protein
LSNYGNERKAQKNINILDLNIFDEKETKNWACFSDENSGTSL